MVWVEDPGTVIYVFPRGMARDGAAILMATHDLFRARETGTHIGIMRDGVLRAEFVASEIDHVSLENEYLKIMKED
jgi:ABC-2 type transport system ATP-binding protein